MKHKITRTKIKRIHFQMYILCLCLLFEYDIRLKILFRKKNHENSLL